MKWGETEEVWKCIYLIPLSVTTAYMMSADLWMSPTVKAEILKTFLQQNEAQNDVIRAF